MRIKLITQNTDASIGLRLAGIETLCKRDAESLESELELAMNEEELGVLLITPGVEQMCPDSVGEIRRRGRPLLVTVPDSENEFTGAGAIGEYVKNAIGIKID